MTPRRLRLWLAGFLFVLAVVIIVISLLPAPRIQQVLPVPPVILPTPTGSAWIEPVHPHGWALAGSWFETGVS